MFGLVPFRNGEVGRAKDLWDMDGIFESFFKDSVLPGFYANSSYMKVDIRENDKEYVLDAELPGISKQDIELDIDDNVLTISVNHQEEVKEENVRFIRKERRAASMKRSFALENVLPDQATAKFEDGVLTIRLPKKELIQSTNKRIAIE